MTTRKNDGPDGGLISRYLEGDVSIDMSDPDKAEVDLITIGHRLAMSTDRAEAAMGLMLKAMSPGFCWALKETFAKEGKHSEARDVQDFISALANVSAILSAMSISVMVKPVGYETVIKDISDMFHNAMELNVLDPKGVIGRKSDA